MGRVSVDVYGARAAAGAMLRGAQLIPRAIAEDFRAELGPRLSTVVYPDAAPKDSGRLAEEITHEVRGQALQVISPVRSPEGFPYTGITRFGHTVAFIYPRRARALRFEIGARTVFAARVRGYNPGSDWAARALPRANEEVADAADRIGRRIERAI